MFAWTTEPTDDGRFAAVVYKPLTADRRTAKRKGDIAAWSPVDEQRFPQRADAEACPQRWYVAQVMRRGRRQPPVAAVITVCGGVLHEGDPLMHHQPDEWVSHPAAPGAELAVTAVDTRSSTEKKQG